MLRKGGWAAVGILPTFIAANYMPRFVLHTFLGVLLLALIIVGWFRYHEKLIKTFYILASMVVAIVYFTIPYEIYDRPISLYESKKINAQVMLIEDNSGYWLAKVENAACEGHAIGLHGETYIPVFGYEVKPYDIVDVEFILQRADNGSHDSFVADSVKILKVTQPERKKLIQHLDEFRESVITLLQVRIGGEEGLFVASVLTGESSDLPIDTQLHFSRTGLSHIMAVSGLHLSILTAMVSHLLSQMNANRTVTIIISLLFVGLVVILGGFSISVLRAALMSGIMLMGRLGYREADPLNSLCIALIVIAFLFPFRVVEPSYLLSGAATLGILVLSPILEQFVLSRMVLSHRQRKQLSLICVSISSAIFTAPILIFYFGEISVLSVPAMSIVNYPVEFILIGAVVFCCLFWIPFLGDFIGFLVRIAAQLVLELVELLASFDQATISVRSLPMILIFVVSFLAVILWFLLKKKIKIRNILVAALAGFVTVLVGIVPFYSLSFSRLTALPDGASIYINHGKSIVVDCSTRYLANEVKQEVGKHGFEEIDVLLVTNLDEDVSGGVPMLLSYLSAKKIIMPSSDLYSDSYRKIVEAAQRTNAEIVWIDKDYRLSVDKIDINLYVTEEQGFWVKITDEERSIGISSSVNDKTITQSLRYPPGELHVDTLVIGSKAGKGSVNAKLMYVTRPDSVCVSLARRNLTLDEKLDIEAANVKLCELTSLQLKAIYDYRKE